VCCSGVFELRLKSFINDRGKDSAGQCCSGTPSQDSGACSGPCRTRFRVCLKHYQAKIDTTSPCTYGDVITPVLGENTVRLVGSAQQDGFANPIRFPFDFAWPDIGEKLMYRLAQKPVNLKHYLVLTGVFRFKAARQFGQRYHSVVSCALNVEDLISNNL
ncbi:hypothetical protein B7P43_G10396, partial [Cryptotermes secundus]